MSFIKNIFGYGKKNPETKDNEDKDEKTNSKSGVQSTGTNSKNDSSSNYSKCKAVAVPYIDTKESVLRVENLSLFDGKVFLQEKLYPLFVEAVKKYEKSKFDDEHRIPESNKGGGIDFPNKEITSLIRSTGMDLIKQVGKKILKGDFNLTNITFPIKVMIPLTILQSIARSLFQFPYYMELAKGKDLLERFKYLIVASISSFHCSIFFLKPLNPVLGETYEAIFSDGSKIFMEQASHHPPVSYYEIYGPENEWYYSGHSKYSSFPGVNSMVVYNKGKRMIKFKDGTIIDFEFVKVSYK